MNQAYERKFNGYTLPRIIISDNYIMCYLQEMMSMVARTSKIILSFMSHGTFAN
jgi:hypothetical protein